MEVFMKNTIQVLTVAASVVTSVSFIGFNRSLNDSEMTEAKDKASQWLRYEVQNSDYGKFLKAINLDKKAKLNDETLRIKEMTESYDCSSLNKVITIGDGEAEAIQDFKIGIKNCSNIMSENTKLDPESLILNFNNMIADYQDALESLEYPDEVVLRQKFEIVFFRYSHLLKETDGTVLEPMTYYVLGDSAMRANNENLFMVGPVLLSKVIFKFKDSLEITQYAWVRLQENIKFGYTGSSGDNTPESWDRLLKDMSYIVTSNS